MIILLVILVILDAVNDALYDRGNKLASGFVDMAYLGVMIFGVVMAYGV